MKKTILYLAFAAMLPLCSCSGKQASSESSATENADYVSPLESGNYRAVSFQYGDLVTDRTRFDGRILMALDPDNSGIYIYENGNRTDFKAAITFSKPFEKEGELYVAYDSKNRPVTLIQGNENDTLMFTKSDKEVKVAFERKPITVMTPANAWAQISEKCQ